MFKIFEHLPYTQRPPINAHAEVSSWARCLNFGLTLNLHRYFVYLNSEDSSESAFLQPFLLDNEISTKTSCAGLIRYFRDGSRISGKRVHRIKGMEVHFADLSHFS